ncbi:hypothetical protein P4S73_30210 [Paraglaciecola sp. Hal342]
MAKTNSYAAEHSRRVVYLGGAAKLLSIAGYFIPRLRDFGMKYVMAPLQKTEKRPRPLAHNKLYVADKNTEQRAEVHRKVKETSTYRFVVTHPREQPGQY